MSTKPKARKYINTEESLEAKSGSDMPSELKSEGKQLSKSIVDSFWNELLAGSFKSTTEQVLNVSSKKKVSGEMKMGEEVSFNSHKQEDYAEVNDPHEDLMRGKLHQEYFRQDVESIEIKKQQETDYVIKQEVEEIRVEIKKLIASSKQMEAIFKDVASTIDTPIKEPGTYHLNFYNWVKIMLHNARMRMEEGVSWAKTMSNKRAEKQYSSMAKKHGTSFTLHHDRTPATQTG